MIKSTSWYRWPTYRPEPSLSERDLWICGRLSMLASACTMLLVLIGSFVR